MADNIAWNKYFGPSAGTPLSPAARNALTRVTVAELESDKPLAAILKRATSEAAVAKEAHKSLLFVAGRARRLAVESHAVELRDLLAEQHAQSVGGEVRKSLGEVACAVVVSGIKAGLLVVQAAPKTAEATV